MTYRFLLCFLLLTFTPASVLLGGTAAAQQMETAIINILVTDDKRAPLANADVTLVKNDGQGLAIIKKTNAQGKAIFSGITPGKYTLKVEATDFESIVDEQYDVQAGTIMEQPIGLAPRNVVEVKAGNDTLTSANAAPETKLTPQEIRTAPLLDRDILAGVPLTPGVVRTGDGRISIKGSRENQSAVLVNGGIENDPATGNFSVNIPLEAIQQVEVFTNPYLPEYGKFTGGVTKIETKRGGDKFEFAVNDFFPEPRFRNGQLFGFANVSPRVNFSGPLAANRAYVSQGLEFMVDKAPVRGLASPNNEIRRRGFRSFSQFDFVLTPQQTFTGTVNFSRRSVKGVDLDFFTPRPVAPNLRGDDLSLAGTYRYSLTNGSLLENRFNYKRIENDILSNGPDLTTITPVGRTGNFFSETARVTERFQYQLSDTLAEITTGGGVHRVKFGLDINSMRGRGSVNNRSVLIRRADGTLSQRIDFANVGDLRADNTEISGYVQDQWLIRPNLALDYGLRIEAQGAASAINLAPRAALSYSPGNSDRTVIRAGAGIFYDKLPLNALAFQRLPRQIVTDFAADGVTPLGAPRAFVNQIVSNSDGSPSGSGEFRVPFNTTFKVEFAQRFGEKTLVKLGYVDSRTRDDLFISPVSSGGANVVQLLNFGRGRYRAFEATANFKISQNDNLTVTYVRSKARAELNDFISFFGDFPDPVIRPNQFSNANSDAPNRLLVRGTFRLPFALTVVPIVEYRNGFPFSRRDETQNFIGVRNDGATRFPRFFSADVAFTKEVKVPEALKISLFGKKADFKSALFTLSVFNITDHFNPRNVFNNAAAPDSGVFFANFRRFFRLDFGVRF
jgi:hypothetical protein